MGNHLFLRNLLLGILTGCVGGFFALSGLAMHITLNLGLVASVSWICIAIGIILFKDMRS